MVLAVTLLLAQVGPETSGQWVTSVVSGLGSAGVATGILWKIHSDHVKRSSEREDRLMAELAAERADKKALTSRLFLLADRGMAVGQTASEVVKGEAEAREPELIQQMERIMALLEARGGR